MRVTPSGILLHHRIGNLAQVGLLRRELERETPTFPLLLMKVLYSGTHAGNLVLRFGLNRLTTQLRLVHATRSLAIAFLAELLSPGHASQIMNNGFFGL